MTTQTEITAALTSGPGKRALKDAMVVAFTSREGKDALTAWLLEALTSPPGKDALRNAVRAELEEGFANHDAPDLSVAKRKKVFPNQEWLFDTVGGFSNSMKELLDELRKEGLIDQEDKK